MSNLTDEYSDDWLRALQSDAEDVKLILNRVESLGILAVEHIRRRDLAAALGKLAEMSEGIQIVRRLLGVQ
jgi:hypothetical protein